MAVKLTTASEFSLTQATPIQTNIVDDSTYSSPIHYPNKTQDYSFYVAPGMMAVLTAYNIEGTSAVHVFKIIKTSGMSQVGGGPCCDVVKHAIKSRVAMRSRICALDMVDCHPVSTIKTPGIYEIKPTEDNPDIFVTLDVYPLQDIDSWKQ